MPLVPYTTDRRLGNRCRMSSGWSTFDQSMDTGIWVAVGVVGFLSFPGLRNQVNGKNENREEARVTSEEVQRVNSGVHRR